jgi:hypothetical protein
MCTATWRCTADGYTLCFNRDEARTRAAEQAPRLFRRGGVECVAPFDGLAGGTWIGANELGFAACLLNAYPDQGRTQPTAPRSGRLLSRGFLVLGLLDAWSVGAARRRVEEGDLRWFQPFRLLALAPREAPLLLAWDGRTLAERELDAEAGLLCSSGWNDAAANAARGALWNERFARRAPDEDDLPAFHASHRAPGPAAAPVARDDAEDAGSGASVCMHRADAATVSFARLRITARTVSLLYSPQPPCVAISGTELELPRRRASTGRAAGFDKDRGAARPDRVAAAAPS